MTNEKHDKPEHDATGADSTKHSADIATKPRNTVRESCSALPFPTQSCSAHQTKEHEIPVLPKNHHLLVFDDHSLLIFTTHLTVLVLVLRKGGETPGFPNSYPPPFRRWLDFNFLPVLYILRRKLLPRHFH